MKVVIFLGPSLEAEEAKKILDLAEYRPPAGRGDVAGAADEGFGIIGLVDGVFYQKTAVSPREILYALKKGVKVVGGSSIGALRACELDAYGMMGVGRIYRWYKEGVISADDEVAVVFHPTTYQPLSEPLVNIRATLEALVSRGMISQREEEIIINSAKEIPFHLRNYSRIIQKAMEKLGGERARTVLDLLKKERIDQKKLDAIEVLKKIRDLVTTNGSV
ncbi:MAG: TfuA-related McrA-glycine thioamidation protein [Candidatus Methanomethyliales bacterium]|nr:TfuA-related McrA-glycine thioamidation protein [Candidatus Methanomethylicales archaeon]